MQSLKMAMAAALVLPGLAYADPPSAAQATSWSGCYGGLTAGDVVDGKSSKSNAVNVAGPLHEAQPAYIAMSGPIGGVDLGCNMQFSESPQFSRFVFGPELEGAVQNVGGTSNQPNLLSPGETIRSSVKSTFAGAASLRLGYAFRNFLIYGKGGAAFTTFKHSGYIFNDASGATTDITGNSKRASVGYLVGAGAEMALSRHWSAKLEYNYIDFGSVNTTYEISLDPGTPAAAVLTGPSRAHEDEQLIKTSLIYRFF